MRKLASVQRIAEVRAIEGADNIEAVRVNGWWVVSKKGEFSAGDFCVYFEIDSFVPHAVAPFLSRGEPHEFNGVRGERLRTAKMRGQLSQGLVMPIAAACADIPPLVEGFDLTEYLGVQLFERNDFRLGGDAIGAFPSFLRKTDQERIQNIPEIINDKGLWECTVKLDGSSMTVYQHNGEYGVCSRNLNLNLNAKHNAFVAAADKLLFSRGVRFGGLAFQGELIGPGIQGNKEKLDHHDFYVFDIYEIDARRYLSPGERMTVCESLCLNHVPIVSASTRLPESIDAALAMADGPSLYAKNREGIVFKKLDGSASFKVISNKYLLKGD